MGKQGAPPEGGYTPPGVSGQQVKSTRRYGGIGGVGGKDQWEDQSGQWHDGSSPAQPSPYQQAAEAQAHSNRPTQNTPFASSGWSQDPKTGEWTQNVGLNGSLAGANTSMQDQLASAWANPLDNGSQARQHAEDAIYQRAASRLDPMWNERERSMGAELVNQGIDPNSEAYAKASGNFGRNRNDAYSSALMDAITGGGQEASRQQQMDLTSRMAPMAGLSGLQGLTQMPGFRPGPDYLAAAMAHNQYGMDAAKMNNQNWADIMSGISSLAQGGAAVAGAACDERLKEDVVRHPVDILPGVPLASFRYKWDKPGTQHLGVIAQDLEAKYPHLVTRTVGGYRRVPFALLLKWDA